MTRVLSWGVGKLALSGNMGNNSEEPVKLGREHIYIPATPFALVGEHVHGLPAVRGMT